MGDFNAPPRLRNACDACHKLKRRCSGAMPCQNCATTGASCCYSLAGRLGRPRNSKTRRPSEAVSASKSHKTDSGATTSSTASSEDAFNDMLDLDFDAFDTRPAYKMPLDETQSPDAVMSVFSTSSADGLHGLESLLNMNSSSMIRTASTPPSHSVMQLDFDPQLQLGLSQQSRQYQRDSVYRHPQCQLGRDTPPPSCECIPGLSGLLHNLKRSDGDGLAPNRLDDVLSQVSDVLNQLSVLVACSRCQGDANGAGGSDDYGETLLLAAMSMRRILGQLKAVGWRSGAKELDQSDEHDGGPDLNIGAFQVTGSDRATMLNVLRIITVRKLDAAITTMQSMLRTKQSRQGESDVAMLQHIESMLDTLAAAIKLQ